MKHLRKLVLASTLTISGFTAGFAGGNGYGALLESSADLQTRVKNMIHIPVPTQGELNGEVDFVLRVNNQGRLEVISASGDHAEVVISIKNDLDDAKVNADGALVGKTYRMNFKYSTQEGQATSPQAI